MAHGNAVVTVISTKTDKVLDIEILHRNCKSSNLMEEVHKTDYQCYDTSRVCYELSAPNMERVGAVNMFERSKHSLRYTVYYGDEDDMIWERIPKIHYI